MDADQRGRRQRPARASRSTSARPRARLHELDPTRPVAADLWGRVLPNRRAACSPSVDAIGVTDYVGWYEGLDLDAAGQAAMTRERLARSCARLFPDKPIVMTELGAAGTRARSPAAAFGGLRLPGRPARRGACASCATSPA